MITHVGHGSVFNHQGVIAEVTLEHLRRTQADHLRQLEAYAKKRGVHLPYRDPRKEGDIFAQGIVIDELIQQLEPPNQAWLHQVNVTVRSHYLRHLLKDNPDALKALDLTPKDGELRPQALTTNLSGAAYVSKCDNEGVPIFDTIQLDKNASVVTGNSKPPLNTWVNWGIFDGEFAGSGEAQLWSYERATPNPGICLALPRWSGNTIPLFGIVCLGYNTGKVCYFDRRGTKNNEIVPIEDFISGAGLHTPLPSDPTNFDPGGVCSDCHAGGNPFVVHPDKTPFSNMLKRSAQTKLSSPIWPDHIVHSTWPNTGPLAAMPIPPSNEQACNNCHIANTHIQFPQISTRLEGYCGILDFSYLSTLKTMPPSTGTPGSYNTHFQYLKALCDVPPEPGSTTTDIPEDDPGVLSPPLVFSPIYGCSQIVGVTGARLHAEVTVFVNGNPVGPQTVTNPRETTFELNSPLNVGDQVTATQSFGGVTSALSKVVLVTAYQGNLPAPTIAPQLTHECAQSIAIDHIEGMFLHLYVNGQEVHTGWGGSRGYTRMNAPTPFVLGDTIEVVQSVCGEPSPPSDAVQAQQAPNPLRALTIDPLTFYTGQELVMVSSIVEGAFISVSEQTLGPLVTYFSWPTNYRELNVGADLGRPIEAGDQLTFTQALCASTSPPLTSSPSSVQSCSEMPAPQIEQPFDGDDFIVVRSAVPGTTIRVWANGSDEIGDGAGNPIGLTRPVQSGETLVVTQQLGECQAIEAFIIDVL